MRVALVNTNRMRPPIGPIGLDYVAEALNARGYRPEVLDLCWEPDPPAAMVRFFGGSEFDLVGVTLRNTDDCSYTTRQSFVGEFSEIVAGIRARSAAPIIAGGVGFSVMPEYVLSKCAADAGIWADGEFAFPELAARIESRLDWRGVPGLVTQERRNPPAFGDLGTLPPMTRAWVDNPRYFREGGQAGFETKRGCHGQCTYCADPVAKGARVRLRPPSAVAAELECLLAQGIDHFHTCDAEFNLPESHAHAVCEEFTRRGLGGRMRWYAYCAPAPFSPELARAMRQAGCVGINFDADNGDAGMLHRLRRAHKPADIVNASRRAKQEGMTVMLDLMLGSPGESRGSLERTVELMRIADPDRVGVSVGVRVYTGTPLARALGVVAESAEPAFFFEPEVAGVAFSLLDELIGSDERFLFFDPTRPDRNYNYNANQRLIDAIQAGHRGAYWDILRLWRP